MSERLDKIMHDLLDTKYWDMAIKGRFRVLQLRQEWDKETCLQIRDKVIESLTMTTKIKEQLIEVQEEIAFLEQSEIKSYDQDQYISAVNREEFLRKLIED